MLRALERWVQEGLQPDLTLWFDVEPALAASRRAAARAADRFEAEDLAFFERVRAGYLARMREAPERDRPHRQRARQGRGASADRGGAGGARGAPRMSSPAPTPIGSRRAPATSTACRGWRRRCGARSRRSRRTRSSSTGRAASASSSSRSRSPRAGCARPTTARSSIGRAGAARAASCTRRTRTPICWCSFPRRCANRSAGTSAATKARRRARAAKRKPSKEIRVEAVRAAIAFATTTSARGRGKVVVVHPAERMNDVAASAFLKTLEEPAGDARFLLCSAAPDSLLPTIRSRCQQVVLPVPPAADAEAWLARQGVAAARRAARRQRRPAAGRRSTCAERGIDAAAWLALPRRIAAGDATALQGWGLPARGRRAAEDLPRRAGAARAAARRATSRANVSSARRISTRCCAGRASWRASPPRPSTPGASTWRSKAWSGRGGKR